MSKFINASGIAGCLAGAMMLVSTSAMAMCPSGQVLHDGQCGWPREHAKQCGADQISKDGQCYSKVSTPPQSQCADGQTLASDGKCYAMPASNATATTSAPPAG